MKSSFLSGLVIAIFGAIFGITLQQVFNAYGNPFEARTEIVWGKVENPSRIGGETDVSLFLSNDGGAAAKDVAIFFRKVPDASSIPEISQYACTVEDRGYRCLFSEIPPDANIRMDFFGLVSDDIIAVDLGTSRIVETKMELPQFTDVTSKFSFWLTLLLSLAGVLSAVVSLFMARGIQVDLEAASLDLTRLTEKQNEEIKRSLERNEDAKK